MISLILPNLTITNEKKKTFIEVINCIICLVPFNYNLKCCASYKDWEPRKGLLLLFTTDGT